MATYPSLQLINRALYTAGVVARDFEQPTPDQTTDGLFLLNELLDFKAADTKLIPYWKRTTLNLVKGQELYFVPNLYEIETMTFNIDVVRYPMNEIPRVAYFGNGRVDNIESIPFQWHYERTQGGSNISVYYLPNQDYVARITGKYALTDVDLFTDLLTVYDTFYISYLRYGLAEYMCQFYDIEFAADKKDELNKKETAIIWVSPPDLTMQKTSLISNNTPLNWAQINIGKGWYV